MLPQGPYNPKDHEDKIYQLWEQSGFFAPIDDPRKKPYSLVLPPPNVTGTLHVGHALMLVIEDILIRYHRLLGFKTLWLPGTDHAAIATQSKVEKILSKEEGKTRSDFGREEFLKRVEDYAQKSHDTIIKQTKKIGASLDWSREAYTLDEKRTHAVYTAFKKMYDLGLIYQGDRVINWDPKGQTTISDDEVVYKERDAVLYTFKYAKDFPFAIATTRPETKLGDTAVAVHPTDKRYKKYIGQEFDLEFCNEPIHLKVIADEAVDPAFGTGALGVTPAHSMIDWEMAQKHSLPLKQIIDEQAKIMVGGKNLQGKKVEEAREIVVEWLKEKNLLIKQEKIKQNVATAERTGALIEPLPKKQWFVNVNSKFEIRNSKLKNIKTGQKVSLKELMRSVVESGEIKIIPERFEKIYFHWIDNLRDWCISRQIWYGHRIPVYYRKPVISNDQFPISKQIQNSKLSRVLGIKNSSDEIYIGEKAPTGEGWEQDPDTLDTWFSSGLWTFSTLGWPEQTADLKTFHPTAVLETGYDILFFWVARMILMSTCLLGDIPFKKVYLHGLVRDAEKQKMNKSRGNVVDPLGVIEEYGADALRMALVFSTGQGADIAFQKDKILAQKKFSNKIWNASKFVLNNLDKNFSPTTPPPPQAGGDSRDAIYRVSKNRDDAINGISIKDPDDQNILAALEKTIKSVTKNLDNFMFHQAAQDIYQFFWHDFCDIYLEAVKPRLSNADEASKKTAQEILFYVLLSSLKILHPFMPFISEIIYQSLPVKKAPFLMVADWPVK